MFGAIYSFCLDLALSMRKKARQDKSNVIDCDY
jgi:hypothetical protein